MTAPVSNSSIQITSIPCAVCKVNPKIGEVFKKCSRCHGESYCGIECQKKHWKIHKVECKKLREATIKEATIKETTKEYLQLKDMLAEVVCQIGIKATELGEKNIDNPSIKDIVKDYVKKEINKYEDDENRRKYLLHKLVILGVDVSSLDKSSLKTSESKNVKKED